MTAMTQPFSLFPNSVPKISLPNPSKRNSSLQKVSVIEKSVELDVLDDSGARLRKISTESIGHAITTDVVVLRAAAKNSGRRTISKNSSLEPVSIDSASSTLVHGNREDTNRSPIVPIRSMFPTYNPDIPISQQNYYPQLPYPTHVSNLSRNNVSRKEYRRSITTPIDRVVGIKTAPASIINFPSDVLSISEPKFSSQKEMEILWDATHGSDANGLTKAFDLEMIRLSEAEFVFGAEPGFPFYTLKTFDTNEITVLKTCPRKRTLNREVVNANLEPVEARNTPQGGPVTFIFPKLAALLAINQSATLAQEYNLPAADRDDVEQAAVRRAAQQEACHVRWNPGKRRYELEHPAIGRNARSPDYSVSPASAEQTHLDKPHVLHMTISSTSNLANPSTPPVIFVTNPYPTLTPENSAGPGLRLSTMPQSDSLDTPLATLDFGNLTLHIDAARILSLMPSLFAIDSLVSAMFAVAVADETTNPIMASMPLWRPVPKPLGNGSLYAGSFKDFTGNVFYATIAEREEAEQEAKALRKAHEKEMKRNGKAKAKGLQGTNTKKQRTWYGRPVKPSPAGGDEEAPGALPGQTIKDKGKTRITIHEFDLEKLGHYQAGDRKGQELPAVTRGIVGGLVMGLKLIVWVLTVIVQFLTWLLVNVSRAVTSEKF